MRLIYARYNPQCNSCLLYTSLCCQYNSLTVCKVAFYSFRDFTALWHYLGCCLLIYFKAPLSMAYSCLLYTSCACPIAFSNSSTDSRISSAVILRNTLVMTLAPARSNALALSYSQFVPGNTGINTVGFATLDVYKRQLPVWRASYPVLLSLL